LGNANYRSAAVADEGEAIMSKTPVSPIQRMVNSVWKAVRKLEERPAPPLRVKLDGRRGYGDGDIPAPDRSLDHE
jgi:hypothetical protein